MAVEPHLFMFAATLLTVVYTMFRASEGNRNLHALRSSILAHPVKRYWPHQRDVSRATCADDNSHRTAPSTIYVAV